MSEDIENAQGTTPRESLENSGGQTSDSKKHWRKPASLRQFSAQVNAVATMVLNGQIDMETARTFSSLSRVLAQAASLEVTRSRFLKSVPDLTIDEEP